MPFSWVRISSHTSQKIRECAGDDHSKVRFAECVQEIATSDGGSVEQLWFEPNGKFAHAHIYWETYEQKQNIIFDLEAEDVVDLYSPEEIDDMNAERYSAS